MSAESDDQEDREDSDDDPANEIDEEWPPNPLNEVDDEWPPPHNHMDDLDDLPPAPPTRKRRASPSFDAVVAAGPALAGPHRRHRAHAHRAAKRARKIEEHGHVTRPAATRRHVQSSTRLDVNSFDTATLPVALGAYTAKTEGRKEKYGSKQRRSVAELIGLGFQLIRWNGL